MLAERSPHAVLDELASHPRGDDLARLVHAVAFAMADERRTSFADGLAEAAERANIGAADAGTSFGHVLRALAQQDGEGAGPAARVLLGTLLARGVSLSPPDGSEAEARVVETLVFLATHTVVDGLPAIDAALGDRAAGLWSALAALLRRADEGVAPLLGRAGALVSAAALGGSTSPTARGEAARLAPTARDPIVRKLLAQASAAAPRGEGVTVSGEIVAAPRGPVALVVLALTGLLFVAHVARLFARVALRYRRHAELRSSPRGLTVIVRSELLGRRLRERETVFPAAGLASVAREVRYPRLGLYAGLFALAVGSYLGASVFVDGARAGSPELVGLGALIVAVGVALDYVLTSVSGATAGKCRVVIEPRKGATIAIGHVDPAQADAALAELAQP